MGDHTDDGDGTASTRRGRKPQRTHRGRTVEERRSERRAALREAGLDLFGTAGFAATSITEVCRTSGVTTRYFYEEYGSLEALLLDVFEHYGAEVVAQVMAREGDHTGRAVTELRSRTQTYLDLVTADERIARVVVIESGSAALAERRRLGRSVFSDFLVDRARSLDTGRQFDAVDLRLMALFYITAVEGAVIDWVLTPSADRQSIDRIVDTLVRVVEKVLAPDAPADET